MKKIIIKLLDLIRFKQSFSQHGEDVVLASFFEELGRRYKGFYIDVGAHHPIRFSNTHMFYKNGWKGINIDATPNSMRLFRLLRSRDTNLEFGIGEVPGVLKFYCFDEPALNGFNPVVAEERNTNTKYKIKKVVEVPVLTLNSVLEKFPLNQPIDFLSIDVEGYDLEVLKSIDLNQYKPKFILVEDTFDEEGFSDSEIKKYLTSFKYKLQARTKITSIFKYSD